MDEGFSPEYKGFLTVKLQETFTNIDDVEEIVSRMLEMLEKIKIDSLPKTIKTNRINFFASH
jgi:hypothetical protein